MIAEMKGKISSTGSNLSERLEDKLIGDFFGALRYIPYYRKSEEWRKWEQQEFYFVILDG
ncbi:hypothetical protein TR13x_10785 [Caloranaerobacter sp. TR13]|uniref:hypothetical protein n=1 Tax=Caloranaerobacter sp. TR13 TaxID=1302151 RepID=UPI0006D48116|nr:hypothetical protein [Caloranaerobacter sp. TR13]KPU26283.1 hypothetical protein TR13x_10785 [Caloranaerobacter sp. TR13]